MFFVAFDVLEVAQRFVDLRHKGKRVGVLLQDFFQIGNLMFVDDTNKHLQIGVRVHSAGVDFRHGVMQSVDDFLRNFVGILCDNFELDGALDCFEHVVANQNANKTVQNAQNDGVHIKAVDKVTGNGNGNVQNKNDVHYASVRFERIVNTRDDIRTAGRGVNTHCQCRYKSRDGACSNGRKQWGNVGVVDELLQKLGVFPKEQSNGKDGGKQK